MWCIYSRVQGVSQWPWRACRRTCVVCVSSSTIIYFPSATAGVLASQTQIRTHLNRAAVTAAHAHSTRESLPAHMPRATSAPRSSCDRTGPHPHGRRPRTSAVLPRSVYALEPGPRGLPARLQALLARTAHGPGAADRCCNHSASTGQCELVACMPVHETALMGCVQEQGLTQKGERQAGNRTCLCAAPEPRPAAATVPTAACWPASLGLARAAPQPTAASPQGMSAPRKEA